MSADRTSLARLVARDPALPGLAVLLDEDRLLEVAATAFPDLTFRSGRRSYTRYKHATNCLCLYEVERTANVRELLTVKTYSADNAHKRDKTARAIAAGSSHAALAEPALELTRLPFDPKLPALQTLFDELARPALLRDVFPDDPACWEEPCWEVDGQIECGDYCELYPDEPDCRDEPGCETHD